VRKSDALNAERACVAGLSARGTHLGRCQAQSPAARGPLRLWVKMRHRGRALAPVEVLLGALFFGSLLMGCGSTSATTRNDTGYVIGVGKVGGLGRVLVDGRGMVLYIYTPDHQGQSVCRGVCLVQWPPVLLSGTKKGLATGPGVNRALLGTVRRAHGSLQLTYNRWPLYTYRLDKIPGEASGEENDMGLWQVISPGGQPLP
jgi:predicted lipoprotein with Yx(FWY)xxD motif